MTIPNIKTNRSLRISRFPDTFEAFSLPGRSWFAHQLLDVLENGCWCIIQRNLQISNLIK